MLQLNLVLDSEILFNMGKKTENIIGSKVFTIVGRVLFNTFCSSLILSKSFWSLNIREQSILIFVSCSTPSKSLVLILTVQIYRAGSSVSAANLWFVCIDVT